MPTQPHPSRRRAAIIGGGVAGCYAAYLLAQQGREVVLFEQAPTVGGRSRSWHEQGWTIDSGAGFFTNFYPSLWALLPALGLDTAVVPLSRSNALTDGQEVVHFSVGSVASLARFKWLGPAAKVRLAVQTAAIWAKHRRLDLSLPRSLAPADTTSIRDAAVRRFGDATYQYLVRPGIEPFWYFSCADASAALLLALHAKAPTARFFTLKFGMGQLCDRLVRDLDVRTNAEVVQVAAAGSRLYLSGERLGAGAADPFDEVVIATTADAASKLCQGLSDQLTAASVRSYIASQTYVANTHAAFLTDAPLPAMSALLACGPASQPVAAINFNSYKQQGEASAARVGREAVSVFLSAAASQATLHVGRGDLFSHIWRLARAFMPQLPAHAEPLQLVQRPVAMPIPEVGRYRLAAAAWQQQRAPVVFAGDYWATATVDGALRSASEAIRLLL